MIVDAILGFFVSCLEWVVDLLPTLAPPDISAHVDKLVPLFEFFGWLNLYFPLAECFFVIGLALTVWVAMHAVQVALWILTKAHILGGD